MKGVYSTSNGANGLGTVDIVQRTDLLLWTAHLFGDDRNNSL